MRKEQVVYADPSVKVTMFGEKVVIVKHGVVVAFSRAQFDEVVRGYQREKDQEENSTGAAEG